MSESTELMQQYYALKAQQPGAILLFQVGDFYETFEEDAQLVSALLGLNLTRRNNGKAGDVLLAGFPVRALDTYLPQLVAAGYRVAICDQVEDPKKARRIVRREITQIATAATYWPSEEELTSTLYMATFWAYQPEEAVLFLADVAASGRVLYYKGKLARLEGLLSAFAPKEVLVYPDQEPLLKTLYTDSVRLEPLPEWYFDKNLLPELFRAIYGYTAPPKAVFLEDTHIGGAYAAFLKYLQDMRFTQLPHLDFPRLIPVDKTAILPANTLRHLEILTPLQAGGKTLLDVLRCTVTAGGTRLLRARLSLPLTDVPTLENRLDRVEALYKLAERYAEWKALLRGVGDLERRLARLSTAKATPREVAHLYFGLKACKNLHDSLPALFHLSEELLGALEQVEQIIAKYLRLEPTPPYTGERPGEGTVIAEGIDEALDRARYLRTHAEEAIQALAARERERLGIPNLKIQLNRQLGYVFHITASHLAKVPPEYRLRQQLAQGMARFSSPELDRLSAEIASAEEILAEREPLIYAQLLQTLKPYVPLLRRIAHWAAEVDVSLALAEVAHKYHYTRPVFTDKPVITIRQGRHPVIERFLPPHQPYQPNDLHLTPETKILLITGPNMAGKSAYMRQNALIILLAQIGSFVPAEQAEIHPVDQILTRIGASDNLAAGESTFLVEMQEAAQILHQATDQSFIVLDEIGRGTSTYDGLAIAWALLEYLHNTPNCRPWTLFATHYHELTQLEAALPRLANYHLAVEQRGNKLIFLHQLRRGAMRRSFGLNVAEMAGLPPTVIRRATELLEYLQRQSTPASAISDTLFSLPPDKENQLRKRLLELDPNTLTPIEALFKLQELRQLAAQS
ncbi:MAG: DNA mismatch repair protein MutS [Bacteroidia bacterium]